MTEEQMKYVENLGYSEDRYNPRKWTKKHGDVSIEMYITINSNNQVTGINMYICVGNCIADGDINTDMVVNLLADIPAMERRLLNKQLLQIERYKKHILEAINGNNII